MAHETPAQESARFKAESDLRTLIEAEKIKKDRSRMAEVGKMAKEQKKALDALGKEDN